MAPPQGAQRKKKPRRSKGASARGAAKAATVRTASRPFPWVPIGLAVFSASISFLAFPGFDVWPLVPVCLVPLFFALDWEPRITNRQAVLCSILFGFTGMWGGYYWVVSMLQEFSGFPMPLCILFASLLNLAQGGMMALFAWLYFRMRGVGMMPLLAAPIAHGAAEVIYPMLFPYYYGNHLHDFPIFIQIADIGGPILVTMLIDVMNVCVYLVVRGLLRREAVPWRQAGVAAGLVLATALYGAWRIADVDARVAAAPAITVAMPQVSMGILEKRDDPWEGQRRHIEMSLALERDHHPDLLVWPESAYTFFLPDGATNVKGRVMGPISTPLLFGGLQRRQVDGTEHHYNTAFLVDANGEILGSYDKTYLLAFGEYLPLGETFPVLYDWSPHSGRFTPGNHVRPLPFGPYRITTLICYEDIIPAFVRRAVREGNPHLLVNVTNDAWFGHTTEPWEHLALAKFRAVEHHRFLVRSTNSGVSAIVDPVGRVLENTGVFTTESLVGEVRMLDGWTPYLYLGDWPGWLSLAVVLGLALRAFRRRRRGAVPSSA